MAPNTAEDHLAFVLSVIQNTELGKTNYIKVAEKHKMSSANTAQKRFKAIVESTGDFKLVKGQVIAADADDKPDTSAVAPTVTAAPAAATATAVANAKAPRAPKKTTTTPATPKKRKLNSGESKKAPKFEIVEDDSDNED